MLCLLFWGILFTIVLFLFVPALFLSYYRWQPGSLAAFFSFTQKTASQLFSIRICRRIFFSIRDTCTFEIPSFPAICACVMS